MLCICAEQRQVDDGAEREPGGPLQDGAGGVGRAGHQRAARVLPADPPGQPPHPVRLPRARQHTQPAAFARHPPEGPFLSLITHLITHTCTITFQMLDLRAVCLRADPAGELPGAD